MHLDHDHVAGGHTHDHEHEHTHEHTHADGTTHTHEHAHEHTHEHDHPHTHEELHALGIEHTHDHAHPHDHGHPHCDRSACSGECAGCADVDPKTELIALMKYMVGHNAAHANELAQLAGKLQDMGESVAYEQVMQAVSDFEKGNMRLSTVLAALNA